jgi:hypothetical protein
MGDSLNSAASVASGVASGVAKVGSTAIWAAGSYISSYVKPSTAALTDGSEGLAGQVEGDVGVMIQGGGPLRGLGGSEMIRLASTLSGIFSGKRSGSHIKQPEVPRLVVVGTQSSGKSSLLNGIMGADILPLGEQMVTRAPLSLQLVHHPDPEGMRAEFGRFVDGGWVVDTPISLQCPDPTTAQMAQIRAAIDQATEERAGAQKAVSNEPIFLRIFSPHVPNLSLVDLPGLTMTALTDQGQPRDIKAQIRAMVSSYIEQERTIILMVCPARPDLEADPAVELVKEVDPQVGVSGAVGQRGGRCVR